MKRYNFKKKISTFLIALSLLNPAATLAHGGRTDSSGGHKDNKNKSGLGSYHYHCGKSPAHLHTNGCPYSSGAKANTQTKNTKASTSAKKEEMKSIQTKLNELGYECGEPDGIAGKKTKDAIKQFQKDQGLKADGIAGAKTKEKLGL